MSSSRGRDKVLILLLVALVSTTGGLGYYVAAITAKASAAPITTGVGPYRLTLVEIMNSGWNTTLAQPKFYVEGPTGLESSANISLPVNTTIELTILAYDTPTANSTDAMGVVNGTTVNGMYMINGSMASMSSMPTQWGQTIKSVPGAMLAHTFSIPQLGVNVPVVGGNTEIAYLYFTKAGSFTWICLTPCGFGPNGAQGAMSTMGWMSGTVTIS
jgi:heme/copper-type cytochrome/quinol oxidase subunit 2